MMGLLHEGEVQLDAGDEASDDRHRPEWPPPRLANQTPPHQSRHSANDVIVACSVWPGKTPKCRNPPPTHAATHKAYGKRDEQQNLQHFTCSEHLSQNGFHQVLTSDDSVKLKSWNAISITTPFIVLAQVCCFTKMGGRGQEKAPAFGDEFFGEKAFGDVCSKKIYQHRPQIA